MQVQPMQSEFLINALQYCNFTQSNSEKLIVNLSQKLKVCPKLLVQQLMHRVEQVPNKHPDPVIRLNFLNKALLKCEKITPELKERIALKMGVAALAIQQ